MPIYNFSIIRWCTGIPRPDIQTIDIDNPSDSDDFEMREMLVHCKEKGIEVKEGAVFTYHKKIPHIGFRGKETYTNWNINYIIRDVL